MPMGEGIMVSPVDIINAQQALPGAARENSGTELVGTHMKIPLKTDNFHKLVLSLFWYPEVFISKISFELMRAPISLVYINRYETHNFGLTLSKEVKKGLRLYTDLLIFNKKHPFQQYYQLVKADGPYTNALLGVEWEPDSLYRFALEYYYQGEGLSDGEWERALNTSKWHYPPLLYMSLDNTHYQRNQLLYPKKKYFFVHGGFGDKKGSTELMVNYIQDFNDSLSLASMALLYRYGSSMNFSLGIGYMSAEKSQTIYYGSASYRF
jgi:hypothetical protein